MGEKLTAQDYREVILQLQLWNGTVNTFTVSNISWAFNLGHNSLSIIFFAKKRIRVFLKRTSQLSEIYFRDEIVELADIIDNEYIIHLAKILIYKVNIMRNPTTN